VSFEFVGLERTPIERDRGVGIVDDQVGANSAEAGGLVLRRPRCSLRG
jgi:hypothetical protein